MGKLTIKASKETKKKIADFYKVNLKELRNKDKWECIACQNQTFILYECSDFPFFDCVCSQCGCIHIRR